MSTAQRLICDRNSRAQALLRRYTLGMGLRIKELRQAAGLTQSDLAEKAGLDRSQLSKIENEREPANTRRLAAIAAALGVGVVDLFTQNHGQDYRATILALCDMLSEAEREAVIAHARALAALHGKGEGES
jgi:transcriptional regulator with XRE-family HTH domain